MGPRITVRLEPELLAWLDQIAAAQGAKRADVIRGLLTRLHEADDAEE